MARIEGRARRVLIVTANFAAPGINTWLLDDLAESLVANGVSVDVLVVSPTAPRPSGSQVSEHGGEIYSVGAVNRPVNGWSKVISYVRTAIRAHTDGWRWVKPRHYDLCISTSISSFSLGIPERLRREGVVDQWLAIIWDFFPVHNIEIGRIKPHWLARPLKAIEQRSLRRADTIAIMSPAGEHFLRRYFPALQQRTFTLPPWSRDSFPGRTTHHSDEALHLTFGGQLVAGRDVDTLIRAMALLPPSSRANLAIAGSGPLEAALKSLVLDLELKNVSFVGQLDRGSYFELLRASDAGVTTSPGHVSIPSFPSKIAGYCGMGLPVIMAVEPHSDYWEQLEKAGAGISVAAGDAERLASAIARLEVEFLADGLATRRKAARQFFEDHLSADSAARRIIREMGLA